LISKKIYSEMPKFVDVDVIDRYFHPYRAYAPDMRLRWASATLFPAERHRKMLCRSFRAWAFAILFISVVTASARAATLYDESVSGNGDLSNNQSAPKALTLAPGTNSIIGSVIGGTDTMDWLLLTLPTGDQLTSLVLANYVSTDNQGFIGVQILQNGATGFMGSPESDATAYLGYAHYGKSVTNGSLPVADLRGVDILPIMGNTTAAPGSHGFTPPLGANTYVFLIQQTGGSLTNYQFDFNVVPEPGSLCLMAVGGLLHWAITCWRTGISAM
jgi:hypothetical protein